MCFIAKGGLSRSIASQALGLTIAVEQQAFGIQQLVIIEYDPAHETFFRSKQKPSLIDVWWANPLVGTRFHCFTMNNWLLAAPALSLYISGLQRNQQTSEVFSGAIMLHLLPGLTSVCHETNRDQTTQIADVFPDKQDILG